MVQVHTQRSSVTEFLLEDLLTAAATDAAPFAAPEVTPLYEVDVASAAGWLCPPLTTSLTSLPDDEDFCPVFRVPAPAPTPEDGYGSFDQLLVEPGWVRDNTPAITLLRVGPLVKHGSDSQRARRCIRARLRQQPGPAFGTGPGTHSGLVCLWCASDLAVGQCREFPEEYDDDGYSICPVLLTQNLLPGRGKTQHRAVHVS